MIDKLNYNKWDVIMELVEQRLVVIQDMDLEVDITERFIDKTDVLIEKILVHDTDYEFVNEEDTKVEEMREDDLTLETGESQISD